MSNDVSTLKVTALVDELKNLSSGEIQVVISNPTDRPGGERVTISAYGEQYETMGLAEAYALLSAWRSSLVSAGVRSLAKMDKGKAYRATLFRTATDGWSVNTQAMDGAPVTGSFPVPTRTFEASWAQESASYEAAQRGYVSAFGWVAVPERPGTFVTVLLKD